MARFPLIFAFMTTCFLCATAQGAGDIINDVVNALAKGIGQSDVRTRLIKEIGKKSDDILNRAQERILEISERISALGIENNEMSKKAFDKYNSVKKSLMSSRRELRKLADKTKTACEELEDYLAGWDNAVDYEARREYFKEQV